MIGSRKRWRELGRVGEWKGESDGKRERVIGSRTGWREIGRGRSW